MSRKKSVTIGKRRLIITSIVTLCLCLSSCTATRVLTNTAESKTTEDGTYVIQTKITESYFGQKN